MPNLKEVKERIASVQNTQQITNAMKLVAAAKLRRSQDAITQIRPYSEKIREILSNVALNVDQDTITNIYSERRPVERVLIVLLTSDRGLCGAFNSNITKEVARLISEVYPEQHQAGNVRLMTLGKKGLDFAKKREEHVMDEQVDLFKNLNFMTARTSALKAISMFTSKEVDEVVLVYNGFRNVATQVVTTEQFLPIMPASIESEGEFTLNTDYIFEPSVEFIIEDLIPKSLNIQFYKAVLESNASEHGARMTAMDKATENAGDLLKELKLMYNRSRQAAITKEILEIVGGANALEQ